MTTKGFYSEWATVGGHRIFFHCRSGYPDRWMRFIARVAAATVESHSESARVVEVYRDDKAGMTWVTVASDDAADKELEDTVDSVLDNMTNSGNHRSQVTIVEPGERRSEHYDHTRHLIEKAGVGG